MPAVTSTAFCAYIRANFARATEGTEVRGEHLKLFDCKCGISQGKCSFSAKDSQWQQRKGQVRQKNH